MTKLVFLYVYINVYLYADNNPHLFINVKYTPRSRFIELGIGLTWSSVNGISTLSCPPVFCGWIKWPWWITLVGRERWTFIITKLHRLWWSHSTCKL